MNVNNLSSLISPIRSRCLQIRVPAVTAVEVERILHKINKLEKTKMTKRIVSHISKNCQGNLRKAILVLQTCSIHGVKNPALIPIPQWEVFAQHIVENLVCSKNLQSMMETKEKFYQLLMTGFSVAEIISRMMEHIITLTDDIEIIRKCVSISAECEQKSQKGKHDIFYLEAFAASLVSEIRPCIIKN